MTPMVTMMLVLATAGQTAPAPTLEQLKNATYKGVADSPVTLRDGVYEGKPLQPGSPMRTRIALLPATSVTGDLNGDGTPETVVLLWKASGGSGVFTYLAVVVAKRGGVDNVGTALIGDRDQVQSLSIAGTRIVLNVIGHGKGEPMCCPTEKQRRTWEFTGTGLKERPTQVLGTLTLADLEGRIWTLKSLERDAPLPAGVTVTMAVKNGRITGMGGCNTYSGSIAPGDNAHALTVGPLLSTRMFCEGPRGEVEATYFAALQAVVQFGFSAGDLTFTSKDRDAIKTLTYSGK